MGRSPPVREPDERSLQGSNPQDPKASVILPPEILDKVLENIPSDEGGQPTLIACALVATWWTGPSQRRLFSSVEIYEGNYQRWMDGVVLPRPKAHLLGYVRSLCHFHGTELRDLAQESGEYLSALRNVHSLMLVNTWVKYVSEDNFRTCFSAFRETLTHLSLENFPTSFNTFVALVDYFPNITSLQLCSLQLEPDEGSVPSLSRPLRGKICLREVEAGHLEVFNRFAKLDLEYEEMVIDSFYFTVGETFLESALQVSASTLKYLRLTADLPRE